MKIRVVETNVYEYKPDFEADSFYDDNGVKTIEEAIVFDKKWIEDQKGTIREDLVQDDEPTTTRVWQLIGDDDSVVATF